MKTVQMTLDESLVEEVDRAAFALGTTRAAFTRDALRSAIAHLRRHELEARHRSGYERNPVQPGELDAFDNPGHPHGSAPHRK